MYPESCRRSPKTHPVYPSGQHHSHLDAPDTSSKFLMSDDPHVIPDGSGSTAVGRNEVASAIVPDDGRYVPLRHTGLPALCHWHCPSLEGWEVPMMPRIHLKDVIASLESQSPSKSNVARMVKWCGDSDSRPRSKSPGPLGLDGGHETIALVDRRFVAEEDIRGAGPRVPPDSLVEAPCSSHEPTSTPTSPDPTACARFPRQVCLCDTSRIIDAMARDPEVLLGPEEFNVADVTWSNPSIVVGTPPTLVARHLNQIFDSMRD